MVQAVYLAELSYGIRYTAQTFLVQYCIIVSSDPSI